MISNFCEILHEVNNEFCGIRKHGTDKKSSQCSGLVASDEGNQSPEQACKKKSCKNLVHWAFHVINVTLFGSRGTSSANWLSSGSSRVRFHVLHGFARIQTWDRVSVPSENHDERTVPKVHMLHLSLLSQHHPTVLQSDISASLFHTQRDSVLRKCFQTRVLVFQTETRRRKASQGIVDTTTVHHQRSKNLFRFRLPVSQIQLSEQNFFQANVCRQFRHRRLPLLHFCCRSRSCHPSQSARMPGYLKHV